MPLSVLLLLSSQLHASQPFSFMYARLFYTPPPPTLPVHAFGLAPIPKYIGVPEMNRVLDLVEEARWEWNKHYLFPEIKSVEMFRDESGSCKHLAYTKNGSIHVCASSRTYLPGFGGDRVNGEWIRIFTHEIGHLLWVPHSIYYHDIMYPVADGQFRTISKTDIWLARGKFLLHDDFGDDVLYWSSPDNGWEWKSKDEVIKEKK